MAVYSLEREEKVVEYTRTLFDALCSTVLESMSMPSILIRISALHLAQVAIETV